MPPPLMIRAMKMAEGSGVTTCSCGVIEEGGVVGVVHLFLHHGEGVDAVLVRLEGLAHFGVGAVVVLQAQKDQDDLEVVLYPVVYLPH